MHELYHASLGHCTGRTLPDYDRKLANCAMDLAINSLNNMRTAPDWVLMPGRGDFKFLEGAHEMASEWYANELKRKQEEDPDEGNEGTDGGEGQFDDHEEFEPGDGGDRRRVS